MLAHVPDINSFAARLAAVLKPEGTITMEFPHLMQLIQNSQFDTIYHEHFYYLSLTAVQRIFQTHGLEIYDVELLETHGGSLRIYAAHRSYGMVRMEGSVSDLLAREKYRSQSRCKAVDVRDVGQHVVADDQVVLSIL